MPVLYFLPWVIITEEISVGNLRLVPYERGVQPMILDGVTLADIDSILGNYGNPTHSEKYLPAPVKKATLVSWNDATHRPTDEDIQTNLQVGQQLAFCALAKRRFRSNLDYCNADGYQMTAQRFEVGNGSAAVMTTRRRDGCTINCLSGKATVPYFIRPFHVDNWLSLGIDNDLLNSLQRVDDPELKERLAAAIDVFLRANTDAREVLEQTEIVLLRAAFETLLDASHKSDELVCRFVDHFKRDIPSPPMA